MLLARRVSMILALAALSVLPVRAVSPDIVISQVYGGGGNSGSTFKNDFIELFNRGASSVNVTGWSVQYASATGTTWQVTNLSGTIPAGGYYLVQEAQGAGGTTNLPTPDATGMISMSATAGKVALVNTTTMMSGSGCPFAASVVDFVGFGTTANCFEGAGSTPAPSNTTAVLRAAGGCTDTDANSSDFASGAPNPRNSSTPLAPCGGPPPLNLTINDVSLNEGNAGTTTFTFTVSLSAQAGPGGVTFDIATADGTATQPSDYTQKSLTAQTIAMGSSTYTFDVLVNGDTTPEPNETFFVNVTNVTGAMVADGQGQGTIVNDEVTLTPIHDIQGNGASSPLTGMSVTTTGVVTGLKSNGFFIQEPDASVDADPATSEGVFVFTSSAPPAAAALGNLVQVMATVSEFVPSADPLQPPLTELTSPTVSLISSGNPLPVPIPLNATFPDPAGPFDQLERLEGMRVSVASLTVVGPTQGTVNEANATSTSNGVFYGVVTGVPRPFREPGIPAPDPAPSGGGTIPPIPRFDSNPERIRVDSDVLGGSVLDVGAGAVVTGLVGPLDYSFRTYTIDPEPGSPPVASGGPVATAVATATGQEFTVASYNMERFFDTVDDAGKSDAVLTPAAFNMRLGKASLAIRDYLHAPDIVGVEEMENLTTLQALAARISSDAIAAAEPDPQYAAYLVEGNDIGGIDVGFLVKTAPVAGSTPRVTVNAVVQELAGTLFVNPDSSTELLNDRPPLRLDAVVNHPNGASFPVTVIVNHLRSLSSVNSETPGSNGWPTDGARVRAKRQKQAEDLANLVQARQTADPTEHIVLVGDFNAFEVNDGLVDSMDVIAGTPVPDNETAVPGDGVDLVNPDLVNLFNTPPPAERYSYNFDGNAQTLDHILVDAPLVSDTLARRIEHARLDADFPEVARNNAATPLRLSDHDPVVAYFQVAAFATADLAVTKTDTPDPVTAGTNLTYTITVTNNGPDPADTASWNDMLPAGTTFVSLSSVAGWSCTTPAVGAGGLISCTNPTFAVGSAMFTLTVAVDPATAAGTVISNTAGVNSATGEGNPGDESATATTTVAASADLSVTKVDTPDPVLDGQDVTYTITVTNAGPSSASTVTLNDVEPGGTSPAPLTPPAGWSCTPQLGAGFSCTTASMPPGQAVFTVVLQVGPQQPDGRVLINSVDVSSATPDPNGNDNSATAQTTVHAASALSATKTVSGSFAPGGAVTYTLEVTNAGPTTEFDSAGDELTDVLPASLQLVSAMASSGTALATPGTNTVTWNGTLDAGASTTITIQATVKSAVAPGTTVSNQASLSWDSNGDLVADATAVSDDPGARGATDPTSFVVAGAAPAPIPTLDEMGLMLLALLLAAAGGWMLRRRSASL